MLLFRPNPTGASQVKEEAVLDPDLRAAWKTLLGSLINDGGRLRLFPHRVVLFLSLAKDAVPADRNEFLRSATEAFIEWSRLARGIGGEHQLIAVRPELSPVLVEQMASRLDRYRAICERFATEVSHVLDGRTCIEREGERIVALARFVTTDLLACMNELVASFELELADTAKRTQGMSDEAQANSAAVLASASSASQLVEELGRVNSRVRHISFNALIEAARAREHGAIFSTVAQEIKAMSQEISSLTERIRAELNRR